MYHIIFFPQTSEDEPENITALPFRYHTFTLHDRVFKICTQQIDLYIN